MAYRDTALAPVPSLTRWQELRCRIARKFSGKSIVPGITLLKNTLHVKPKVTRNLSGLVVEFKCEVCHDEWSWVGNI